MYARIIRAQVPPEHFDEVLEATRQHNVPMVKQFPGFVGGYWTGDPQTGKVTTFVLLEGEEGIRAAESGAEKMRSLQDQFGVQLDSIENLEVLMSEAGPER